MLKSILSIGGKPGLYKMVSQTKNGLIVESLHDQKRIPAFSSSKISALEDISVFTEDEDVALVDVFKSISEMENEGECLSPKSGNEELKNYMLKVLPTYDTDRVYVSDIKKILNWYNILHSLKMLNFEEEAKKDKKEEDKKEEGGEVKKKEIKKAPKKKVATASRKTYNTKATKAKFASKPQPKTKSK